MRKSLLCLLLNFLVIAPQIANPAEEALLGTGNLAIKVDFIKFTDDISVFLDKIF